MTTTSNGNRKLSPGAEVLLGVWLILVVLAAGLVGLFWLMAPLGLGFSDSAMRDDEFARWLFYVSWFVGLPVLVLGQITAVILAFWNLRGAAALATGVLAVFLFMVGWVIAQW